MTEVKDMWARTAEMAKAHGSSTFLKLANDGDKAVVVFLGAPYPRELVFTEGRSEVFSDKHRERGLKPKLRISFCVALYDTKELRVFEQGVTFFNHLDKLRKKRPLEAWAFEVERNGAAGDSNTTYATLPEHELTAAQQTEFAALEVIDFATLYESGGDGGEDEPPQELEQYESKRLLTPKEAAPLIARLKRLDIDDVRQLVAKFGVKKVQQLTVGQLDAVRAAVTEAEAQHANWARRSEDTDSDPFAD